MDIVFVYDILENVYNVSNLDQLAVELFPATTANSLIAALKDLGHQVTVVDGASEFVSLANELSRRDVFVFNESKGLVGHDRKLIVPALCRHFGIPCLGSDGYGVTLARNKWHTLSIVAQLGVPTPRSLLIRQDNVSPDLGWALFPAFVKPNFESSSIGIDSESLSVNSEQLTAKVRNIHMNFNQPALVQEYLPGKEIQVAVIGNKQPRALSPVEISIYDQLGRRREFIRNTDWRESTVVKFDRLEPQLLANKAADFAVQVYLALGLQDYGRIDFLHHEDQIVFLEAATHPHITPEASFTTAAGLSGFSHSEMLQNLLTTALERSSGGN